MYPSVSSLSPSPLAPWTQRQHSYTRSRSVSIHRVRDSVVFQRTYCSIVRIIGASFLIAARKGSSSTATNLIAADILDVTGLASLLLAGISVLGLVYVLILVISSKLSKTLINQSICSRRSGRYGDNASILRVFVTSPTAPASSLHALLTLLAFSLTVVPAARDNEYSPNADYRWQTLRQTGAILFAVVFVLLVLAHVVQGICYRLQPSLGTVRGREVSFVHALRKC
jgi:hypothetical protein